MDPSHQRDWKDGRKNVRMAFEVAAYLRGVKCCVNVIPYNPRTASPWPAPSEETVQAFLGWLQEAGQFCKKRITQGREHMAARGQLGNRELRLRREGRAVGNALSE